MNCYDPLETCPYDPVHRIMRSRMQYHLTKCAKNWPCAKKKQCPFDARHIINEIEFNYHISVCPQRESVWRYKITEDKQVEQPKILPIDTKCAAVATEENWDDDVKVKSYNPLKSTENRPVIRSLEGAQKAQRKQHQLKERLRHSCLDDEGVQNESAIKNNINKHASTLMKSTIPECLSAEVDPDYKPLRRPKKLPLDTSKVSDFSTVNSTAGTLTEHSFYQNKSEQVPIQEKTSEKENAIQQPKSKFSYAAALKRQQNSTIESDYDVVIESVKFDDDKENSVFNNVIDENLVKVSNAVEHLTISDEGHKMQSQSLNITLESLKNNLVINNNDSNSNNSRFSKENKPSRCAANFTYTKC